MREAVAIAIMAAVVVVAVFFMVRMARHAGKMRNLAFFLYIAGQLFSTSYLFYLVINHGLDDMLFLLCVLLGVLCIPVDFSLYYVMTTAEKHREAKERVRLLEEQEKALAEQRERLGKEAARAAEVRAKIVEELDGALEAIDAQRPEDVSESFDETIRLIDSTGRRVCQHHVVGALLGMKAQAAEEQGVRVDFDLDVPDDLPFSDTELCAVFSNLFDNAANAVEALEEAEARFISMRAYRRDSFFVVNMENGCANERERRRQRRKGELSEHGWGLSIIETVAKRHGGMLETRRENERFHTTVVMGTGSCD